MYKNFLGYIIVTVLIVVYMGCSFSFSMGVYFYNHSNGEVFIQIKENYLENYTEYRVAENTLLKIDYDSRGKPSEYFEDPYVVYDSIIILNDSGDTINVNPMLIENWEVSNPTRDEGGRIEFYIDQSDF